jgi:hypothetical protein
VGSNPTQSISSILVNYGIGLRLISIIVGQNGSQPIKIKAIRQAKKF